MHMLDQILSTRDSHRRKLETLRNGAVNAMREVGYAVVAGKRDWGAIERHRHAIRREQDAIDALDLLAAEAEHSELQKRSSKLYDELQPVKQRARDIDDEIAKNSKYGGLIGQEILEPLREDFHAATSKQTDIEAKLSANGRRMLEIEEAYPHLGSRLASPSEASAS